MRLRRPALVAVACALVLAGCVDDIGPPVSATTVPESAPSSGGSGPYDLGVRVLDEPGGAPMPGAAVVVYWGRHDGGADFTVSGDAGGGHVSGVVRATSNPATPEPDSTVSLRTGADGIATAHVPANRVVGIVVWRSGHTEEWIPTVATGDRGAGGVLDIPVYRARILYTSEGSWGPAGASPGRVTGTNHMWQPEEVQWGANAQARAGYVHRLATLRMDLSWTNGPTASGDLAIAASRTTSDPDYVADGDNPQVQFGDQVEDTFLDVGQIEALAWPPSDTLYVGPATATAFAAPFGMAYTLGVEATFDPFTNPAAYRQNDSPGPGPLALLVFAGVAVLVRRAGAR